MSDYSDIISSSFGPNNPALPQTVGSLDDDPDKAQRALDLAKATGVAPTTIYGDLDEFERNHKAVLASDIIAGNPHISDYVRSNPMAAKVSNDDYGALDAVSSKVSAMSLPMRVLRAPGALARIAFPDDPLKRWREGGPLGSWLTDDDLKNHPFLSATAAGLATPIELFLRGVTGLAETGADVASNLATAVGGKQFGQEIGAVAEAELMGATGRHPITESPAVQAIQRVRPWVEAGREPLPTVLPEYDAFRTEQNANDLAALKEATSEAQQSLTRERSPELFRQFIDSHTDAEIGIGGDAALALYGDKVPSIDDGLLGWVPGIADKLELARATGSDVAVPLADWLTHVEPEVMQALHDDIRVRPQGITAREAQAAKEIEPSAALPETAPQVRAATALEPLYSIGDRKLELQRMQQDPNTKFGAAQGFHDFNLVDEKGSIIGAINISEQNGGKKLYVDNITGVNGLGPRDFGPALMRDLLRQLKAEFPNAEEIAGHRVSGARERAGKEMVMPEASMKFDNPDVEQFGRILEGGQWETYSAATKAYIKPYAERGLEDRKLVDAVNSVLDTIVPKKLAVQEADRLVAQGSRIEGIEDAEIRPAGTYIQYKDSYPIILYALEGPDPIGTARHEAIHHLRNYGFFDNGEWATLEQAAKDNGWIDRFGIDRRYPEGTQRLKLEESIADAYKDWEAGRPAPSPEVHGIFERLKEFFTKLKERLAEILGKEPTWEDIFQRVSTGEVGQREGSPLDPRAFDEKLSAPEAPEEPARIFQRASALGMTVEQFKAYDRLMAKRHIEDVEAATTRAESAERQRQTKQWKEDRKALRAEVSTDIKQRPDVAADLFFGAGEYFGKKVPLASVKLDAAALTEAQKAGLPHGYYGAKGLHPDDVAPMFGYQSGDAMVDRLIAYNVAKQAAGKMSAKDFVSRVTDMETDRQMAIKYGSLENNIIDSVKEQVASQTQLDILHEETVKLGLDAGTNILDKSTITKQLQDQLAKMPLGSVSSDAYLKAAGKAGKTAEMALLTGDAAGAFRAKQQQYYATVIARESVKLERDIAAFDKTAKRFSKREVTGIDPEYTNWIHDVLMRVGRQVRRSVQDLETEIAAGEYKTLADFVDGKQSFYLREVAVADILKDPAFRKRFEELTVDEFNAVHTTIKSLVKNGRDERRITKAGVDADLNEVKAQMIEQLGQFQERAYDAKGGRWMGPVPPTVAKVLRTYGTSHIQMENLFNRWDHDNPQGVFQQYVMRDLVDSANNESAMEKRFAAKLRDIDDKADLKKLVENPLFKVPDTDQLMQFNRGNLRTVLLNAGNASNLDKLARGYKTTPEAVRAWIDRHATKEDWDWAQKMGDIFAELKSEADVVYRNLSGVAPESIDIQPVQTPHGEYPGWYYPLIAHPEFEGSGGSKPKDALEQQGFVRATTANGYTKSRTGATYPLALDLDMLPSRMKQMIHDIAMRPAVINASKIFHDKDVRSAIFTRFGGEWRDMLTPYLVDVANSANYVPKNQRLFANASEFIRQNLISTLVGLNPGTVLKHGPTALVQSMHEVGGVEFLKAMKGLFSINEATGENNWQFAMRESQELQRRDRNYIETLGGATDLVAGQSSGYMSLRQTIQRLSAKPVAISDLISAVPTWLAQYEKSVDAGETHGDAVYMADRAVRRAHGSTAITNRSAVQRGGAMAQWFASVYGFFNHIMNRQYELMWKAGETLGLAKDGQYQEAMQRAPELTSMLFAYVLAPAIIEEAVTPLASSDGESWGKKAAKGIGFTLGASWVGIRDIASAVLNGRDPSVGLLPTAAKTITDFARDLGKDRPMSKEHAGKVIKDGATLLGTLSGVVPAQAGRTAEFGYGVAQGTERPKGPWGWLVGARFGTLKGHSTTLQDWQRHR